MATVFNTGAGGGWTSTSNVATYSSGTMATNPAVGDLLVVAYMIDGEVSTDWAVTDNQGGTYTKVARGLFSTSADMVEIHVRNAFVASSVNHVVTAAHAAGNATGSLGCTYGITGMLRVGSNAVRQTAKSENQAAGGTPAVTFAAALANGPVIQQLGNQSNPVGTTEPTGYTPGRFGAHNTPARGSHPPFISAGGTGTTVTWAATSATAFGLVAVEFDTTAPGGFELRRPRRLWAPNGGWWGA